MAHGSGMERKGKFSTKKCCMKNKLLYKDPPAWRGEKNNSYLKIELKGKSHSLSLRDLGLGT